MADHRLRPIERTIRRLRHQGLSSSEMAWRLRRSPGFVERVESLSAIERPGPAEPRPGELRPIERCVLNAVEAGSSYPEIAARLRRSPQYVTRIEQMANLRLAAGGS